MKYYCLVLFIFIFTSVKLNAYKCRANTPSPQIWDVECISYPPYWISTCNHQSLICELSLSSLLMPANEEPSKKEIRNEYKKSLLYMNTVDILNPSFEQDLSNWNKASSYGLSTSNILILEDTPLITPSFGYRSVAFISVVSGEILRLSQAFSINNIGEVKEGDIHEFNLKFTYKYKSEIPFAAQAPFGIKSSFPNNQYFAPLITSQVDTISYFLMLTPIDSLDTIIDTWGVYDEKIYVSADKLGPITPNYYFNLSLAFEFQAKSGFIMVIDDVTLTHSINP